MTLVELLCATTVTSLLVVTLATFAQAVSTIWHEGDEAAQTNQQSRVALVHLRRDVRRALAAATPAGMEDTLVLWAHDDVAPRGSMSLNEIVIICPEYPADRPPRLVRITQELPTFWNFAFGPSAVYGLLTNGALVHLLKTWSYARRALLIENLSSEASSVRFAVRTEPSKTGFDPNALETFVDFHLQAELNPLRGEGAGSTNRELLTIHGTAHNKNHQRWLDAYR